MRRVAVVCATLTAGAVALAACSKKDETGASAGDAPAAAATAPAAMTAPPRRKPGLWSHTVQTAGMSQSTKVCLDEDTDAKMTVWGQAASKEMCSEQSFAPAPGGFTFRSVCNMGSSGTITSNGSVTGDFGSAYTVKVKSSTAGAASAQMNGEHDMTLTARWEGPCPAGMKGGDVKVQIPGGPEMTINMEQMTAMQAGGRK
ncbi:MAG: DUF3617 family protein [Phenylobacterium sp.]|uniref:DUF3617 domain-containing protein n=1 Tax=Phenylobacterium sp. TaxID=1871053 RepID=UPI001A3EC760|nr:DUF3617 family protein [Phenylobacterium sp.]MBL8556073.1 DUF3617 family protein [Phenylobacterium sp.]